MTGLQNYFIYCLNTNLCTSVYNIYIYIILITQSDDVTVRSKENKYCKTQLVRRNIKLVITFN